MAEVAVAFAGFTALASVFVGRQVRDHPRQSSYLLRGMIEASLVVVLFSLLPLVLDRTPLVLSSVWRICSGACAAFWMTAAAIFIRDGVKLQRELKLPSESRFSVLMGTNLLFGNGMLLLTACGAFESWPGGAYLVGLLCLLANSALSFTRFFFGAYEHIPE